jgi:hypothetical protein
MEETSMAKLTEENIQEIIESLHLSEDELNNARMRLKDAKGQGDSPEKVLSTDLMKNFPPIPHGDMEQVGDEALSAVAGGVPAMSPAMLDKMYLKKYLPDLYEKLQQGGVWN